MKITSSKMHFGPLATAAGEAPMLTNEREINLARAAAAGSVQAFNELISSHLRLVFSIARQYDRYGVPTDDLIAEGTLGLVEAARRFDPTKGVRLAAYAAWWIRAYMRRYTLATRRIVRGPATRQGRKLISNLRRAQRELAQREGEPPSVERIAKALGVDPHSVEEVDAYLSGCDVTCGLDEDGRGHEVVAGDPSPEALVGEHEEVRRSSDAVQAALTQLNERERQIVMRRYLCAESSSLSSIGNEMGLSRERVRQLEQQARLKMRQTVLVSVA
jgi:RNA polymerase sigma-32 factor